MNWHIEQTINGKAVLGDGAMLTPTNPATEELIASVPSASLRQLDDAVRAARDTFDSGVWSGWQPSERSVAMHRFVDALAAHADELMEALVNECGSPVGLRELHIEAPIRYMRWCAQMASRRHDVDFGVEIAPWPSASKVVYQPAGVVGAIAAYNYPVMLALTKVGAALAAGCAVVLMPSPQTPLATLLLGALTVEADLPPGVVNVVAGGAEVARALTEHPGVDKVTFTGSVGVGAKVAQQAAAHIKGVVLELGGKNPNLILPDADLDPIIDNVHLRYLRNAGQGCGSPTRILIDAPRLEEFVARSQEVYSRIVTGDPWDLRTTVGPVISAAHRDRVLGHVSAAVADGGRIVAGGEAAEFDRGFWVKPTLLGAVPRTSSAWQEEIFGPVAVVAAYSDVDEAIRMANDTRYGLGASIYTGRVETGLELASRIRCGQVTINGGGPFRPEACAGGVKASGIGREFGLFGIMEFLEPQAVAWRL